MPTDHAAATIKAGGGPESRVAEGEVNRRMLIDGDLVGAEDGQTFASINPADAKIVGHAPNATVAVADKAIAAARRAFDTTGWSTDVAFRIRCLDQLHKALVDRSEELRELTVTEVGATRSLTEGPQLDGPIGMAVAPLIGIPWLCLILGEAGIARRVNWAFEQIQILTGAEPGKDDAESV